ncbi:hypothetical protein ECEC1850_4596, partial [Escherichia coli EC1850]
MAGVLPATLRAV